MSIPDPGHGEPPTGLQRLMGYHLAEWSDGRAMVELEIGPPHLNRAGVSVTAACWPPSWTPP